MCVTCGQNQTFLRGVASVVPERRYSRAVSMRFSAVSWSNGSSDTISAAANRTPLPRCAPIFLARTAYLKIAGSSAYGDVPVLDEVEVPVVIVEITTNAIGARLNTDWAS